MSKEKTKIQESVFPNKQKFYVVVICYLLPHEKGSKVYGNVESYPEDINSLEEAKKYVEEMMEENSFVEEAFILDKDKYIIARFMPTYRRIREVIW